MNPSQNEFWEEFPSASAQDWKKQAQLELKNLKQVEDFAWISEEGIAWKPSYHADDIQKTEIQWIQAGQESRQWSPPLAMARVVWNPVMEESLEEMRQRGIGAWLIDLGGAVPSALELQKSLGAFPWSKLPVFWKSTQPELLYKALKSFMPYPLRGGILDLVQDEESEDWTRSWFSGISLAQSGANAVVELAYLLTQWQKGRGIQVLEYSLQTNFFLDIAKGRALRYLAHKIAVDHELKMPYLIGSFNPYYLTQKSPSTNQLRCTTSAVAALVGGADAYWIPVWNEVPRLSYQISLLLKEEGYLDQVIDPSQGSYFIESLTLALVESVDEFMLTLQGTETISFWQKLADETHENRIAQGPALIGSTLFPSPEKSINSWNFPTWPAIFTPRSLEPTTL